MSNVLIEAKNLSKVFTSRGPGLGGKKLDVRAVNDVSFQIREGETLGLVGESGCGKSTTGRLLIRLLDATNGSVLYRGQDITKSPERAMRGMRNELQIIFQDPYSSLNPRMTCQDIVGEPLYIHTKMSAAARREKVRELLNVVGLPAEYATRYPHEFSGGQRQRIGIARAIALNPKFIVCDEPVSALDVSVQSQVLNLIQKLQREYHLTYLFIAHGLNVVKYISDRVGVMYLGSMVELSGSDEIYKNPMHPYTQSLISAIPDTDLDVKKGRIILKGDVPSPSNLPAGCPFHTRCWRCMDICETEKPAMREVSPLHYAACHLYN